LDNTEILLFVGYFYESNCHENNGMVNTGRWVWILTALVAWYASAAGVANGMAAPRRIVPVGRPLWGASA
jgi:succinate-acetate transporter protein